MDVLGDRGRVRRCRSFSPPRTQGDPIDLETRTKFQRRFTRVVSAMHGELQTYLDDLDKDEGGAITDQGYVHAQLRLQAADLLQTKNFTSANFQGVTDALVKLLMVWYCPQSIFTLMPHRSAAMPSPSCLRW